MDKYSTEIRRGAVFYIRSLYTGNTGSEQKSGRPAVIVSNNRCNVSSPVVEVVYLTTADKHSLPTHVDVRSTPRQSTVLCEQIHSVARERVGDFYCELTKDEMDRIDVALAISLGLDFSSPKEKVVEKVIEKSVVEEVPKEELMRAKIECEMYQKMYYELLEKLIGGNGK